MASRHHSLEMTEIADVRDLLVGFEAQNSVCVGIRMSVYWTGAVPDVLIYAEVHKTREEVGEVPPLASVSVRCLDTGLRNLRDVVIHVLYALDMQLALGEYARIEPKEQ